MSYNTPENLRYSAEHEWAFSDAGTVSIGITDFAQSSLGDIVFVELPEVGSTLEKDATFGVVESIKSVSDLYAPVAGEVVEINEALTDSPESINEDPYQSWLIKIKVSDENQLAAMMNAHEYMNHCESQEQ